MDAVSKITELQKFGSILGLERMRKLMEELGNPQDDLKFIHVAGTNGKGSTSRYLYEILRNSGYKVGLYTSPFIEVFNERIEYDGQLISDSELTKYTDIVLSAVNIIKSQGYDSPTEFEVITAIAFLYYKEKNADLVVLEVGLGGRGDATNIIKNPLASVITSISFDHTEILGDTLKKIAYEKAGIIKEGCPVITSAKDDEALQSIVNVASENNSFFFETRNIPRIIKEASLEKYRFDCDIQGIEYKDIELSMLGEYQVENAILAIATIDILVEEGKIKVNREAIYSGLKIAKNIARVEVMSKNPLVIIDGAHNPDGARSLKETINTLMPNKKILTCVGMLKDKDTNNAIKEFATFTDSFITTTVPSPRKLDAKGLAIEIKAIGKEVQECDDYKLAVKKALELSKNYDLIVFCGSLYLMGAIRPLLR